VEVFRCHGFRFSVLDAGFPPHSSNIPQIRDDLIIQCQHETFESQSNGGGRGVTLAYSASCWLTSGFIANGMGDRNFTFGSTS
jgi:hypothetical protein